MAGGDLEGQGRRIVLVPGAAGQGGLDVGHGEAGQRCRRPAIRGRRPRPRRRIRPGLRRRLALLMNWKPPPRGSGSSHSSTLAYMALAAGLAGVFGPAGGALAQGFLVGHLRAAGVGLDAELARQAVHDDFQVQLAHAEQQSLAGVGIGADPQGRVLLGQLGQGGLAACRVRPGSWARRSSADDRLGEGDGLQDDRPVLGAQRVAGGQALHRAHGHDVAGEDLFDFLPLVGVHLQEAGDALLLVLGRVVEDRSGVGLARVDPEIGQVAQVGVVLDLEDEGGEGVVVGGPPGFGLAGLGVEALDGRDVGRGGQVVDDGVEEGLDALVAEGGAVEDGHDPAGQGGPADGPLDLGRGTVPAFDEHLHDRLVDVGQLFDEQGPALARLRSPLGVDLVVANSVPITSVPQSIPFISTRSMTPRKASSRPMGIWRARGWAPSRERICATARSGSAPTRSILLMNTSRGTRYLSACRQTVSDWGSTPPTPQRSTTAPSRTLSDLSTSAVKSTCPGVSMMLMRWAFQ